MKANEREASQYAPWYDLPRTVLVSIEHPFIIQNVDKAVNMLGGFPKLKSVCTFVELKKHHNDNDLVSGG